MNLSETYQQTEENDYKLSVLKLLKARNVKEHSFEETIKYANKLLEKLDYLQKANAHKNFQTFVSEQTISSGSDHSKYGETVQKADYENVQRNLAESHAKISKLAEQVINLKDTLDAKNLLVTKQSSELEKVEIEFKKNQELNSTLKSELAHTKNSLQSMSDDYTVLNITHSCVENQRNDLEIENKKLRSLVSKHNEEREIFVRLESQKNLLETENMELKKKLESFMELKENIMAIENEKNGLEMENKKLKSQLMMLKRRREHSLSSGSYESVCSVDGSSNKNVGKSAKNESCKTSPPHSSSSNTSNAYPDVSFPDKQKLCFVAHESEVNAVMWYPDPSYLITAGSDRRLKLWEICRDEVKLLTSARDCNSSILSVDIDGKASSVLCASSDFSSRLWDISDFKLGHTLTGHSGKVMSAKFIKESDTIISGSLDKTLKLWGKNKTLCTMTFNAQSPVNDVVSRDSNFIISGHWDRKIRFWDVRTKNSTRSIDASGVLTSLDVSRNGSTLLTSEQDGKLKIFDLRTFKEVRSMSETNFQIVCNWTRAKFSPDGKYCCCGSENGSVYVWNSVTGALEKELRGHDSAVISCNWSSCGSYLATCGNNRKCVIWSKHKGV
ncbi:autophagy-related protein 16-1 [Nephila pilipes]|uniref:Autophagy-related protein 16-1 n=1 Tax=Nephila pilipes TaxID=299642 RepID=A0A8X6P843_NEPPI|nr:autophagy-related protein 16-1 [Nephila pilipes]